MMSKMRNLPVQIRYLIAGGTNTLFGIAFYPMLLWAAPIFQTHYITALLLSYLVCMCFTYATYKIGVFRTRGRINSEFRRFSYFYIFVLCVNWFMLPILVREYGLTPSVSQIAFSIIAAIGGYLWNRRVTFKDLST